jgi:peptide/nickel transport system substrate-binding protein
MKRGLVLVIVCAMLASALAACTPKDPIEPDAPSESVFRYGFTGNWSDTRNPLTFGYAIAGTLYMNLLYEPLIGLDLNNEWDPRLATDWSVSEDGLRWTFKLREGVKWHDGEVFDADDVVYTYKTTIDNQLSRYADVKAFVEVNKIDQYTVELVTEEPKADIILSFVYIVPEHVFGSMTTKEEIVAYQNDQPVGTGPFRFVADSMDQFVEYVANDDYWGGRPGIDRLMMVLYSNADTMYQALATGEIDFCGLQATQEEAAKQVSGLTVLRYTAPSYTELGFNCWGADDDRTKPHPDSKGNPLVLDKTIRQACDYAINFDNIVEYARGGLANIEKSLVPKFISKWWVDLSKEDYYREYSPEKAMALLENAGYIDRDNDGIREDPNGNKLDFRFSVIEASYREQALIIQQDLKKIGINTNIDFIDSGRMSEIIDEQGFDTDMYIWGWSPGTVDPSYALSVITTGQRWGRSDCFYGNPEYDALYEAQKTIIDYDERYAVVKEAVEIAYDEAPYIILYTNVGLVGYNSEDWTGWQQELSGMGSVWNHETRIGLKPVK